MANEFLPRLRALGQLRRGAEGVLDGPWGGRGEAPGGESEEGRRYEKVCRQKGLRIVLHDIQPLYR